MLPYLNDDNYLEYNSPFNIRQDPRRNTGAVEWKNDLDNFSFSFQKNLGLIHKGFKTSARSTLHGLPHIIWNFGESLDWII